MNGPEWTAASPPLQPGQKQTDRKDRERNKVKIRIYPDIIKDSLQTPPDMVFPTKNVSYLVKNS